VFCFKPRAGDLVIFPNHLKHQPHQRPTFDATDFWKSGPRGQCAQRNRRHHRSTETHAGKN
jgi:hypothetical protein